MADFKYALFPCFVFLLFHFPVVSIASDILTATQSIKDGDGGTLVSAGEVFELGFFGPERNSSNRYLGIWYKQIPTQTVVWVANRETPLSPSSGVLKLSAAGALTLLNGTKGTTVWSSNLSSIPATATQSSVVAQLLDSGNLVVRQQNNTAADAASTGDDYWWQSFDYPGNTLLPGMKLGKNLVTGLDRHLTSWKTDGDPSPGQYTLGMRTRGFPQKVIWEGGSINVSRSRPWDGLIFSGLPHSTAVLYKTQFVLTSAEVSYGYRVLNASVNSMTVLSSSGVEKGFTWDHQNRSWVTYYTNPTDKCDTYAACGAYASCDAAAEPTCKCLRGFVPKNPRNLSDGCVRRKELRCPGRSDGFVTYSGMKLPDTSNSWYDRAMNLEGCRVKCLGNCSCSAYSSVDISFQSGSGCVLWFGDLLDIKDFTDNNQPLYVRVESAEIGSHWNKKAGIATGCAVGMVLLGSAVGIYFWRKRMIRIKGKLKDTIKDTEEGMEVPCFNYSTVSNATNNFSWDNKLGEGGFGPVYKGRLEEQDIAVKVLSETSRQGSNEFKNEVLSIAKLQHRNLVKLLGCCIEKQKMLIYEYMPNKSLDYFIFDKERRSLLDWPKRLNIINGISRGLLYLHQDSRLRIVHRDLKASNILLDHEMNPKISDFGLARIFQGNETEASTNRVVGTHGYMSPEYTTEGLFSTKSDVFSFGVLVLEIVSGKQNLGFNNPNHHFNLLGHAWKLHTEAKPLELVDSSMSSSCNSHEALLLIQLGLLCVQQYPKDRPDIARVVQMIGGERQLCSPKYPGFFIERDGSELYSSSIEHNPCSNEGLITTLEPR